VNELALAAFAAANDVHAADRETRTARFERFAASFEAAAFLDGLAARSVRWLARSDAAFPPLLAAIHDPPPGLFLRGNADPDVLALRAVAIVGARSCTDYGAHVARQLAREVAAAGVIVVSGLARGIDGSAHRGSLEGGGQTVAVLGCGIDRDYPRSHAALAVQIADAGLVVSEYPPGVAPAPWRFPARNRIVAGLAVATLVVEARERSGALITADLALEEGRDVLAVPGEITSSLSQGTNALLRLGAVPVTCADDVLDALGVERVEQTGRDPPPGAPAVVLAAIDDGARTADELVRATGIGSAEVAAALTELELAGLVTAAAGVYRC
jgi:DNA processing protein